MPINPNWTRWIKASLAKHFDVKKGTLPFYIEGQIRPTTVTDFAELRMDGPFYNEINYNYWYIDITPAILIQITQDTDIYKLERYIGTFSSAFTKAICMYEYGDGGNQFGALQLLPEANEYVRVDKFGQTQAATRIAQAAIEARYRMYLTV